MTKPIIKTAATASDEASTIDVLVRAFSADPAARWVWPDSQQYHMHFPSFVKAFGGKAFTHGSAYYVDGYTGAALWLPPNVHPDEDALNSIFQQTVSEQIQKNVLAVFDQMGRYHPSEPHWYLPIMGVDPFQQGKGFGSALLQHALIQCDRDSKLPILNLQVRRISPSMNDMALSYLAPFRYEHRLPSFQCSADLSDASNIIVPASARLNLTLVCRQ
jgi:GNAT superfamily N-acetyltransferase